MAEYPTAPPTEDLEWASTGRTANPNNRRVAGWLDGDQPPVEEWNYLAKAHERYISHEHGRVWRRFDDLTEAIDALDPGEVFYFRPPSSKWVDAAIKPTQTPASAVDWLTTDGRRAYYVQAGTLVAATANPNVSVDLEWSILLSSEGVTGTITSIDTDGVIVAITATGGTNQLLVVNAVSGAVIASSPVGGLTFARCYSTGGVARLYTHGGGTIISEWTLAGGLVTLHTLETVGQVMARPIEPAGDRLYFISTDLTLDDNYIIHIPIDGGSETLVDTRSETTASQDFGTLDYDDYYQLMYCATRSSAAAGTDLTLIFDRAGTEIFSVDGEPGPWPLSSRFAFGVGQPYGNAAIIAYRDGFNLRGFGDVSNGVSLNLTTARAIGARYRWYAATVGVNLVTLGILSQPGLWKIRDDVVSGPNRRLIAQPLGVTYG